MQINYFGTPLLIERTSKQERDLQLWAKAWATQLDAAIIDGMKARGELSRLKIVKPKRGNRGRR